MPVSEAVNGEDVGLLVVAERDQEVLSAVVSVVLKEHIVLHEMDQQTCIDHLKGLNVL